MKKKENLEKRKSIKKRIVLLVAGSVLFTVIGNGLITGPGYNKAVKRETQNNMVNYISAYGKLISTSLDNIVNAIEGENMNDLEGIMSEYKDYMFELSYAGVDGKITQSTNKAAVGSSIADYDYVKKVMAGAKYSVGDREESDNGPVFEIAISISDEDGNNQGILLGKMSVAYLAEVISNENHLTKEMYQGQLSNVKMYGYDNVSVYLMDSKGTVMLDADKSYLGTTMENELLFELEKAEENQNGVLVYNDNEQEYYMGYSYISAGGWHLVAEVANKQIFSSLIRLNLFAAFWILVILTGVAFVAYRIARNIAKPIEQTTKVLQKIAVLDFSEIDMEEMERRQDETGLMAESIKTVVEKLSGMVQEIQSSTNVIFDSSTELNEISKELEENAKENLSLTQELAAGMEESTVTYETINDSVASLRTSSDVITDKLSDNVESCNKMLENAQVLTSDTEHALKATKDVYEKVKADAADALERAKAVDKINEIAEAIMDIADQTGLLALNASIEAARAGDAGKGFAVVAEQISHLAGQSAENVSSITEIIAEVNSSVNQMRKNLETSLSFIDRKVLQDYERFVQTSTQYSQESEHIRQETFEITERIKDFMITLEEISEGISETTQTLENASINTAAIADKNSEVVDISTKTSDMSVANMEKSEALNVLIEQFKI